MDRISVWLLATIVLTGVCCRALGAENPETGSPLLVAKPLSRSENESRITKTRFARVMPTDSGVELVNVLDWDHPQGLLFDTGFACGGIAVGDVDSNGLPDLIFISGLGPNRLYLQQSRWKFAEAALQAGRSGSEQLPLGGDGWGTGAALFDIDGDGDLDLYVCNYDSPNSLYINRGDGEFDERAADYGLDIVDACLMPSVADFDRDGDLDIYLAVNRYLEEKKFRRQDLFYWHHGMEYLRPAAKKYVTIRRHYDRPVQLNMWAGRADRLLRNEGPANKFVDVSDQMGLDRGDTLSATWWDYDHDSWPDLYACNDLAAPDRLFHNNRDGTFSDVTRDSLPHTPWLSMGSSAGDVNNDGLVDFLAADMSFRTHFKDKATMGAMSARFRNVGFFPHQQLMRNALLVNSGTPHFQESAQLAGLASTDWTWTAKLADLDNDGRLDAFFTNGSPVNLSGSIESAEAPADPLVLDTTVLRKRYRELPPVLEQNLVYQNQGDLRFVDSSQAWGLDDVGMSFAAVHADMDRDGDLDLIVANLDRPPHLYRNDTLQPGLLIQLHGKTSNRLGVGAQLLLETDLALQVRQVYPVSGFQSCQEAVTHFGVGHAKEIRRLTVRWPSGVVQSFEDLQAGHFYSIQEAEAPAHPPADPATPAAPTPLYAAQTDAIVAEHHEEPFDDFARQPLLPNKLSQLGPPMAWGDIDNDGDDDLFLGEGTDWMGMLYVNRGGMRFVPRPQVCLAQDAAHEDSAAVFLEANGDGNVDLYVASGSVECAAGDGLLGDRLYLGDGTGDFQRAGPGWLPDLRASAGAVAANDFDRDGDVDLLVGSRSIPGAYPLAPAHALLRNEGDRYVEASAEVAPALARAGMITAALWADVDGNGWDDLLVATDWGPVRLYLNEQGALSEITRRAGLDAWTGWWQSLAAADLDGDGDVDFVAGNFGLNTKYQATSSRPVLAFYGEYGDSGGRHLIEASYERGVLFPLRGKSCSSAAMPHLTERFSTYEAFARASLSEIYTPRCLQEAERFEVNSLASACFLNDGQGRFTMLPLPRQAQLAPVFAVAVTKVDGDEIPDLFLAQNFFGPQRETGPMDGGLGVVALGRGDGTFEALRPNYSGVAVPEDAKAAAAIDLDGDGWQDLCVATNNGPIRIFRRLATRREPAPANPPGQSRAWRNTQIGLAKQFFDSGQAEEGLPFLRRALKVAPQDLEALMMLAVIRREQQRFADAQALQTRLRLSSQVDDVVLWEEAARLATSRRRYDEAVPLLRQALATRPDDRGLHLQMGETLLAQGRLEEAGGHFRRAQRLDRVEHTQRRLEVARVLYQQGRRHEDEGEDAEAIQFYQQSRRVDSQRPQTLKDLGMLLQSTSDSALRDPWLAEHLLRQSKMSRPREATAE